MSDQRTKARLAVSEFQSAGRTKFDEDDIRYPKEWVSDIDGGNARCTAKEVTP